MVGRADLAEAVNEQLAAAAMRDDRPWIWVYHAPPDESPTSWTGKRHYGDTDLNGWIEQHHPDLVLCGHVQQSPFEDDGRWIDRVGTSLVFNAGRQIGPVPTYIEIDTDAQHARWSGLTGVEELSFSDV